MSNKAVIALFLAGCVAIVGATVYAAFSVPDVLFRRGGDGCDLASTVPALGAPTETWSVGNEGDRWHAVRTLSYTTTLSDAADLVGCTDTGSVEVVAASGAETVLAVRIVGHGTSEQAARDAARQLDPEVRGDTTHLEAWHPHGRIRYAQGVGATLSLRFEVPASVALDADLSADTGGLVVEGVDLVGLRAHTDTGRIRLEPARAAGALHAATDTGGIEARLAVLEDATVRLRTDTGSLRVQVPADARHGYDLRATTDVGSIAFRLPDLQDSDSHRGHRAARTAGYDAREVQVVLDLATDTGGITVEGS